MSNIVDDDGKSVYREAIGQPHLMNLRNSSHRSRGGQFDLSITGDFTVEELQGVLELIEISLRPVRRIIDASKAEAAK
jgi:hypothetical protein